MALGWKNPSIGHLGPNAEVVSQNSQMRFSLGAVTTYMEEARRGLAQNRLTLCRVKPGLIDDPQGLRIANGEGMIRTQHDLFGSSHIAEKAPASNRQASGIEAAQL